MFKEFLYPLVEYFTPFNIFQYITFRSAYAAVTSLLITFLFGHQIIDLLKRRHIGEEIRGDGPQSHVSKTGTPTMGGVMIIFSTSFSVLLWMDPRNLYTWVSQLAILGFGAVGFIDDYIKVYMGKKSGLPSHVKMAGQLLVSTAIMLLLYFNRHEFTTLLYVPMVKNAVLDLGVLFIPFGVFWLVGFTNAVNLTDGLDGLATGLSIMVGLTFGAIAYLTGRVDFSQYLSIPYLAGAEEITILAFAMVGASVGFLWYNSNPAEVFMGDTGSLMLGGTLGVMSIMIKKELLLVIVGGVFVLETLTVIIQVLSYKMRRKRVFLMAPLHHHFELKGWAETKVVQRFWILGGLFAILGLSTLKIQ